MGDLKIFAITDRAVTFGWPADKIGPFTIRDKELDTLEIAIREARGKKRGTMTVSPINSPNPGPTQILGR